MANAILLRRKIKTAKNISKTTKAMQMIAVSKLRRAQEAALSTRPYAEKLTQVIQGVMPRLESGFSHPYVNTDTNIRKNLYIIIASDKGLNGGMTSNLMREVMKQTKDNEAIFITVGKKIEHGVARLKKEIIGSFAIGNSVPPFATIIPVVKLLNERFLKGEIAKVQVIYMSFINVFSLQPKTMQLLPVQIDQATKEKAEAIELIEPDAEQILPNLLQHYVEMVLYQNLLESYASQQAAQMTAMQNATNNAKDIIEELTLAYNKSRQEKITSEILDIGSAQVAQG